jgi:NADP-dependent 3-hydroxy acid dehydrogenase YdfG
MLDDLVKQYGEQIHPLALDVTDERQYSQQWRKLIKYSKDWML